MLETLRKYWIGMLVLVMISLHASIVGLIRYQASLAKVDMSCEVDLGRYLAFSSNEPIPTAMRLHAIVPLNHRMKSRQLIELNQAQIRQSLEEHIRQLDPKVLTDPYLSDLRTQLLDVMVQTVGKSSIEDLVITEVQKEGREPGMSFVSRGNAPKPRQLVATLRANATEEHADDGDASHSETDPAADEHTESEHSESSDSHDTKPSKPTASTKKGHESSTDSHASGHDSHGETHSKPKARAAVKYESGMGKKKTEEKKSGH